MKLRMSLRTKLYLAFAGMSVLVVVVGVVALVFNRTVNTTFNSAKAGFSDIQSMAELQRRSQEVLVAIDRLFQTHQVELQQERLSISIQALNTELEKVKQSAGNTSPEKIKDNQAIIDKMQLATASIQSTVTEIIRLAESGQWSVARDMRETLLTDQQSDLNDQMRKLALNVEASVQSNFIESERSQDLTRTITIAFTILAITAAIILGLLSTKTITDPLNQLISVVQRVTLHDFSPVIPLSQKDEVGELSQSIALMTEWLRQSYESLEERVSERTVELERQNIKIQVAAEIARDASSSTRELGNMLDQAAGLIVDRFGFYYAGIYLLDDNQEYAVLNAASGSSSQILVERRHKLKVGEVGIVGHVAGSGKARIALDVGTDAVHFQNPLLPDTRSEIALPIKVGSQVLGVLDVQSEAPAAFKDDDINVLQILADLLAVGINNTQLNAEIKAGYLELENFYDSYSREAWRKVAQTEKVSGYQYDQNGAHPISRREYHGKESPADSKPDIAIPLKVRGETIGMLKVWSGANRFLLEDIDLLEDLGGRVSQSLDSARLYAETQRRAEYERLVSQAGASMRESMDVESVLRSAAEEIYQLLNLEQLTIDLSTSVPEGKGNGRSKK